MDGEILAAMKELGEGWVEVETAGADFSDQRLTKRYTRVLEQMSQMPEAALTQSSEDLSEMLGAYRFIDNSKVTVEKILQPHREQISRRAEGEETVLLIQDTSFLDFSNHTTLTDLKPIKLANRQKALWVHPTVCLLPSGLPLGIVDAQFTSGKLKGEYSELDVHLRPIEGRQSRRWLQAVDNCRNVFSKGIQKVWICDREADFYEFFDHLAECGEDYIIRSKHSREIEEGPFFDLRDQVDHAPIEGQYEFSVSANGKRAARTVRMAVKFVPATLTVPQFRRNFVSRKAVPSSAIEVFEIDPIPGEEPIHWKLLTSLKVENIQDALRVVSWYQKRWAIEEIFKILKSGCHAEKAQFHNTTRLNKYLTLSLLVAWRIYFLVHVNRINPEVPAETVLTISELQTLQLLFDDKRKRKNERRVVIKTARQAITQLARLGGHLNRKRDPLPGITVLWRGTLALAYSTMTFLAQQRVANG